MKTLRYFFLVLIIISVFSAMSKVGPLQDVNAAVSVLELKNILVEDATFVRHREITDNKYEITVIDKHGDTKYAYVTSLPAGLKNLHKGSDMKGKYLEGVEFSQETIQDEPFYRELKVETDKYSDEIGENKTVQNTQSVKNRKHNGVIISFKDDEGKLKYIAVRNPSKEVENIKSGASLSGVLFSKNNPGEVLITSNRDDVIIHMGD